MFWVLRGKNLESHGNLKRLHCESVSQLHDCRLRVRLRTSRMGVANHERSRTTMKAAKRERRKNRKQDNDTAVCVSNVCDRICRSSFGLSYSHQSNYTENNPIIIIVVVIGLYTHARTQGPLGGHNIYSFVREPKKLAADSVIVLSARVGQPCL